MASERWQYDVGAKRYRDLTTGRFLSATAAVDLRDDFVQAQRDAMADLGRRLAAGELRIEHFEREFRERLKLAWTTEYVYGRGGRQAMTPDDHAALRGLIREQWQYANQFARDVQAGELSAAQIEARAKLYAGATVHGYERGREAAHDGLRLPGHPASGTACRSACTCSWDIQETDSEWRCYWRRHAADSCATCVGRASRWNPYTQPKGGRVLRVVEAA